MGRVLDYFLIHWQGILMITFFVALVGILLYATYGSDVPGWMNFSGVGSGREY